MVLIDFSKLLVYLGIVLFKKILQKNTFWGKHSFGAALSFDIDYKEDEHQLGKILILKSYQ